MLRIIKLLIMMGWRHRLRCGRRGRIPKPITIGKSPIIDNFTPHPQTYAAPILIEPAEIEVLRLVDLEGMSQEEAGEKMGVSRGTVWRLLQNARRKTAQALSEGRALHITDQISNEK